MDTKDVKAMGKKEMAGAVGKGMVDGAAWSLFGFKSLVGNSVLNLHKLSESKLIYEKLMGLNAILFIMILGIDLSFFHSWARDIFSLKYVAIIVGCLFISLLLSLAYSAFLKLIINFSIHKSDTLSIGLIIFFINLPIAVGGLVFRNPTLIKTSIGIIPLQMVLMPFTSFLQYSKPAKKKMQVDTEKIWTGINKAAALSGIISLILAVGLFVFG